MKMNVKEIKFIFLYEINTSRQHKSTKCTHTRKLRISLCFVFEGNITVFHGKRENHCEPISNQCLFGLNDKPFVSRRRIQVFPING